MSAMVFFTADDGVHGRELWVTDGTSAGTRMVKDIQTPENTPFKNDPYWLSSFPFHFAVLPDGRLIFQASDKTFRSTELWVSDGTEGGTFQLADIGGPDESGAPRLMTALGDGRVVFSAEAGPGTPSAGTGRELWITDGTAAGTTLLKDIRPGLNTWNMPAGSDIESMVALRNGRVVFTADDGVHGREVWGTDGTEAGTVLLQDITPGAPGTSVSLALGTSVLEDGSLVFRASVPVGENAWVQQLWATDGTPGGTRLHEPEDPPDPVTPPPLFRRPVGGEAFPTEATNLDLQPLTPRQSVFRARGAQLVDLDGLLGAELVPDVWENAQQIGVSPIAEAGATVHVRFTGTNGHVLRSTGFASDGTGHAWLTIAEQASLGPGPIRVTAVGPALQVTLDRGTTVRIAYDGGAGTVTQDYSYYSPGKYWFAPSLATMEALGAGPITVASVTGRVYDGPETGFVTIDLPYRLADITASIPTGRELWITDGTEAGTRLLADVNPGAYGSEPDLLAPRVGGRLLFIAQDGSQPDFDGNNSDLWATDGTPGGTVKLASGTGYVAVPYGDVFLTATPGRLILISNTGREVWVTDGTPAGTARVMEGVSSFASAHDLGDGRLLLRVAATDGQPSALWVSDATPRGTILIARDVEMPMMTHSALLDRDTLIARYPHPEDGTEPVVFDLANGGMTVLSGVRPGAASSSPESFILAMPEALRKPVSTLFDTRVTLLQGAPDSFDPNRYFTDPQGGPLSYAVTGLPGGVTWDAAARQISAAPTAAPGRHEITIIAETRLGGRTADSFVWDLVDTGKLVITAEGAWSRADRDSPITLEAGKTLTIGRKDGKAALLRIDEAEASIEDGKLTVSGRIFSPQVATDRPLLKGGFSIDLATLTVSDFKDEKIDASHRLVGDLIEMAFSDLALRPDEVVLRTDLSFGDAFTALSTTGAPLALHLGDAGPSFGLSELGTGRWFSDTPLALPLPEGAPFSVEFSDLGLTYNFLTDSVSLMGKADLTWGETVEAEYSFLADSTTSKLTLDLAGDKSGTDLFETGDKFLRIGKDAQGWTWDIVGEITYEGQEGSKPAKGRPFIEEMTFSLDTVEKEFGGSFKGTLPFLFKGLTLEAEIGAKWDPLALDGFAFGIDGLNQPLGTTGLFVQGGKLAVENLAAQDPDDWPEITAQITMTVGPDTDIFVSPIHGSVTGKIAGAQATLAFEAESKVEYLLPGEIERIGAPLIRWLGIKPDDVLSFELMKLAGDVMFDFARPNLSAGLSAQFLNEMIKGEARFTAQTTDAVTELKASVSALATFPDALPLIGGMSRSGNGLAIFTSDGDNANDFAAAWTSFTVPFYGASSAGVRLWLDGRYEVLGRKAIEAIGSWRLGPEQEVVVLSAQWDTPTDGARLELIAPDGTILREADFGSATGHAAGIALVADLDSPRGRHVALQNPTAGIWDLRLVDEAGLGAVRYEASAMLRGPEATIRSVTLDPGARSGTIALDLAAGDADEVALTLFVSDTPDVLSGFRILDAVIPADAAGALSFDWDLAALASGTWWLHARADAAGLVPEVRMWAAPVVIEGDADLAVTLSQEAVPGGAVLSVTVANLGDAASGAGTLQLVVPTAALGAAALGSALPLTATRTEIALDSLSPGETVRFAFALPTAIAVSPVPATAEVSAAIHDADLGNNSDALFLATLGRDLAGAVTTRGGAALAGVDVTASLADGSAVSARTNADGTFALTGVPPGGGLMTATHAFTTAQAQITAADALEVLRIAVGLAPVRGPAGPLDYIAADIDRNERVTAEDALEVLRHAVGLPTDHAPHWIFVDALADLAAVHPGAVRPPTGIDLALHPADLPFDLTAILAGSLTAPV